QLVVVPLGVQAQHADPAPVRLAQGGDAFHRGGLAGAVGAEDAEDLTGLDRERHVVHGDLRPVFLVQSAHFDNWHTAMVPAGPGPGHRPADPTWGGRRWSAGSTE